MCDKVFKNGASKICGRQLLQNLTWSALEYFVPCILHKKLKTSSLLLSLLSKYIMNVLK